MTTSHALHTHPGRSRLEIAHTPAGILLRDARNRHRPPLELTHAEWAAFTAAAAAFQYTANVAGPVRLNDSQRQLLALLAAGHNNHHIAKLLGIAEDTVKTRLRRLYAKLGVSTRAQAVDQGWRRGILHHGRTDG